MAREYKRTKLNFPGMSESRYQALREQFAQTIQVQKSSKKLAYRRAADHILPKWDSIA